jgi:P4 family phage/plasmid primase-like protien
VTTTSQVHGSTAPPNLSAYVYVDTATGGWNRRNNVQRVDEFRPNGKPDTGCSYQRATDELLTYAREHANERGNPSISGFEGPVWTPIWPADFDADDPQAALAALRTVLDRLEAWGVPLDALRLYYSGSKGFHLEMPATLCGGFPPSVDLPAQLKRLAAGILQDIDFDASAYDRLRLWRAPNTLNGHSGLYKIPLTVAEVRTLSLSEIQVLAVQPRPEPVRPDDDDWLPVEYLVDLWNEARVVPVEHERPARERRAPSDDPERDRLSDEAAIGAWPSVGKRHAFVLHLAGFYAHQGLSAEQITDRLEAVVLGAADDAFLSTRPWRTEIKQAAKWCAERVADSKKVKGLPTLKANYPRLAAILDTLWVPRLDPREWPTQEIPSAPSDSDSPGDSEPPTSGPEADTPIAESDEPAHLTDLGNAQHFVREHGHNLRYCYRFGCWHHWAGRRWEEDERGMVERLAKRTVLNFYRLAAALEDNAERKALVAHARRSEAAGRIEAMVRLARSEPGIAILPDELDRDPWLLNCLNGTLDLRTGRLRPHDPHDLITKLIPIPYDAAAACPLWERFLEQILPDPAVRRFVKRAIGYAATGDTREQALFFLFGGGANGKSTLLNLIMAALGDYAKQAAPELLTYSKNDRHPTELADLVGVRFVASIEVDEGKRLAEALVKQMTGGDRMKARRMRENFFDFAPTHKVFLAANHRPVIRGTDHAIWRRIHLIPFEVSIPPEQQDKQLPTKLYGELPGILRWIVEGCLEWQWAGLGVPQAVANATREYRAEQDVLGAFLEEECEILPTATVTSKALYAAYEAWCKRTGEPPIGQRWLAPRLIERGFQPTRTGAARGWVGLRLRPSHDATSRE